MAAAREQPSTAVLTAAQTLRLDRVSAEVVAAFEAAEMPVLLLKGPGFAHLFYDDGAARGYGDTDLLVRQEDETEAEQVLRGLGFVASPGVGRPDPGVAANHRWFRGADVVELHTSLIGIDAPRDLVWDAFTRAAGRLRVGGREVTVPGRTAQLLHAALHAAQHGVDVGKPSRDLQRALARTGDDEWREVRRTAETLGALGALRAGLQLVPGGAALADRIGATQEPSREEALRAASASPLAKGYERLRKTRGRERLVVIGRVLFPTPGFLRWWTPLARRGRRGLLAAYLWRYAYMVLNAPRAARDLRRAGRR